LIYEIRLIVLLKSPNATLAKQIRSGHDKTDAEVVVVGAVVVVVVIAAAGLNAIPHASN